MLRYDGFVLRKMDDPTQGNIASGISVAVRKLSDNTLADLFNDAAGTSPRDNPLTSDENGKYTFYVANGTYNIDVADGSASQQIPIVSPEDITQEIEDGITGHVNEVDPHAQYAKESDLAAVAVSGDYNDLDNLPAPTDISLKSVAKTNGDSLEWGVINEISATGTFTMPLANAVDGQVLMELYFPSSDAARVVTINRAGSDLFLRGTATDTQYILNVSTAAGSRYITSNGTDRLVI